MQISVRLALLSLVPLALAACGDQDSSGSDTGAAMDSDGDGFPDADDCDPASAEVSPDAEEICDGIDNDGDGDGDEDVTIAVWPDEDGDGYGFGGTSLEVCAVEEGFAEVDGDCDDTRDDIHPDATEDDCTDPNDYNCDGSVAYADFDEDGWAACEDCNDSDATINPDAAELPGDEVDQDCDGTEECYADADGDGYIEGSTTVSSADTDCSDASEGLATDPTGDCDDYDGAFHPDAPEDDCIDQDCDGRDLPAEDDGDDQWSREGCGGCAASAGPAGLLAWSLPMLVAFLRRRSA